MQIFLVRMQAAQCHGAPDAEALLHCSSIIALHFVPADIDASTHTCSTCLMQRLAGLSHRLTFCEMDRVAVAHYALHIIWPQPSMASSMMSCSQLKMMISQDYRAVG